MRFSLKLFCSRATVLPAFYGYREVGHFLFGNTHMSLPSYERYQRLQRLKHTNTSSVFAQNDGVLALGRTATAKNLVSVAGPHPCLIICDFWTHTTPRVLHFSALVCLCILHEATSFGSILLCTRGVGHATTIM